MRRFLRFVPAAATIAVALLAAGCRPAPAPGGASPPGIAGAPAATIVTVPSASPLAGAKPIDLAGVEPALAPFAPVALSSGPIVIKGYPHSIRNGMNDPAQWFGWSRDGSLFGYCAEGGGADVPNKRCELARRDGSVDRRSSYDAKSVPVAAQKAAIDRFIADERWTEIHLDGDLDKIKPPALGGTWAFTDIELSVLRVAATESKSDPSGFSAPALVRVGGAVTGEPAVYPVILQSEGKLAKIAAPHFAVMNGMAVSPDGAEIGMVGHFFACEYCDTFAVKRIRLRALAALVYNDAGFARHKRKDYARAAELFAKAAFADPEAKLPPYNLACALARQGDARAEAALGVAISRGGPDVKARAKKDSDFDGVRASAWFAALVK